jgi:hypothetical protein
MWITLLKAILIAHPPNTNQVLWTLEEGSPDNGEVVE